MLLPFVDCMAVAALLLVPASRAVGSEAADRERTEALKTRVEVAFKSSMVCNGGRCYRRRGPYYIEEYTDVRAQYDDASKPKEFAILATVRVKNVRDGWSPPLPNQAIVTFRVVERRDQEWEFEPIENSSYEETSRIECDELAVLGIAQCSGAPLQEPLYRNVGSRNRTVRKPHR